MMKKLVEVRQSKFGKGLFAKKDIAPGTILCKATGKEMDFKSTVLLNEKESHALQVDFDRYLLCETPFLYSNHSCEPNSGLNENLELIAIEKIKKGEEIFWDYSTSMLERHWTMKCFCGKPSCRKVVTDFDLIPTHIQHKYLEKQIVLTYIVRFLEEGLARVG